MKLTDLNIFDFYNGEEMEELRALKLKNKTNVIKVSIKPYVYIYIYDELCCVLY